MKKFLLSLALPTFCLPVVAESAAPASPEPLASGVFNVSQLPATPTPVGLRREAFDARTATVDKIHCHITTFNAGASSGAPRKHLQEEIIIVKEGEVEANWDGQSKVARAESICWFARCQLPNRLLIDQASGVTPFGALLARSLVPSCRKMRMGFGGFRRMMVG